MHAVNYCAEKLYDSVRTLMHHGCTDRRAMVQALMEFSIGFGSQVDDWAAEAVAEVREAAPFDKMTSNPAEGTIAAWANAATESDLKRTADALLRLFNVTVEEEGRRAKLPR